MRTYQLCEYCVTRGGYGSVEVWTSDAVCCWSSERDVSQNRYICAVAASRSGCERDVCEVVEWCWRVYTPGQQAREPHERWLVGLEWRHRWVSHGGLPQPLWSNLRNRSKTQNQGKTPNYTKCSSRTLNIWYNLTSSISCRTSFIILPIFLAGIIDEVDIWSNWFTECFFWRPSCRRCCCQLLAARTGFPSHNETYIHIHERHSLAFREFPSILPRAWGDPESRDCYI